MNVHEYGPRDAPAVVLIHPSIVMWDYFERVIPLLEDRFHLLVPALPGYDPDEKGDFTSVEQIARDIERWLVSQGYDEVACIYGCSMGGAVVARFLADDAVRACSAVMDGGITPYRLPWIATRLIAIRDFLLIYAGKLGGIRLLEKAFSTDDYSKDDLSYVADVLRMMSARTIWRTFESCNNYTMPEPVRTTCKCIEYWYASGEEKDRAWDISYVRENLLQTTFKVFEGLGHAGLALIEPETFAGEILRLCALAAESCA